MNRLSFWLFAANFGFGILFDSPLNIIVGLVGFLFLAYTSHA